MSVQTRAALKALPARSSGSRLVRDTLVEHDEVADFGRAVMKALARVDATVDRLVLAIKIAGALAGIPTGVLAGITIYRTLTGH